MPHAGDHSIADRRRNFPFGGHASAVALAMCLFGTPATSDATNNALAGFDEDPDGQACVAWLERALAHRGYALLWAERTASDGPSIVDAAPVPAQSAAAVGIAVRGDTAHVTAPFLRYGQARRLVARANGRRDLSFRCALASEVAIAAAQESRLRLPLLLVALGAAALAALALSPRRSAQNAK